MLNAMVDGAASPHDAGPAAHGNVHVAGALARPREFRERLQFGKHDSLRVVLVLFVFFVIIVSRHGNTHHRSSSAKL